jgi:hypothetical protein
MGMLSTALLDTNILLMWLVGLTGPSLFVTFKRVDTFQASDFVLLSRFLQPFRKLITTPHVLAEVSNFIDQAPLHRRKDLIASLKAFVDRYPEHYEAAAILIHRDEFTAFGLTDTGLSALSADAVIVTTDFRLSGRIQALGGNSVNFNHLRTSDLLMR